MKDDNILPDTVHELRTPLGSMRWSLEMLKAGEAGELPVVAQELINQIYENNQRLIGLVNDLLDVWRFEQRSTNSIMAPEPLDVALEITKLCEEAKKWAGQKQVDIRTFFPPEPMPKISADPTAFKKVMTDILSNAVKYVANGGKVLVSAHSGNGFVTIDVEDNGMGIPKEDQAKIFTRFFRARNAILKGVLGTGLGLFIAKLYTEGMGGSIWFESEENKGSVFHVKFPVIK